VKFVILAVGKGCRIVARTDDGAGDEDKCELERQLESFKKAGGSIAKDVDRMFAVFDYIAEHGRERATNFFHEANKKEGIYEFERGALRVYFSFVPYQGQLCVCSHVVRKKKQKAKTADVTAAKKAADEFRQAIDDRTLEFVTRSKGKKP
jgi:hypothetical protein